MASDNPPDIAQYNPGAMRALVPAGLILDLTPWSDAYGWDAVSPRRASQCSPRTRRRRSSARAACMPRPAPFRCSGSTTTRRLVEAAGVDGVPADLGEFDDDLAAVQDSGVAPLSVAGLEVGGFHIWNALLDRIGDVQDYRDWVYGVEGSTIETDAAKEATDTLVDWIDQGFIPESANAVGYADALAAFTSGSAAYHVNGNWAASAIETELGDDVGFFLMPAPEADGPLVASGASVAYSISSKSENPNVAAAFLDYLGSPEAAKVQFDGGFMPVNKDATVEATGLKAEIASAFSELVRGGRDRSVPRLRGAVDDRPARLRCAGPDQQAVHDGPVPGEPPEHLVRIPWLITAPRQSSRRSPPGRLPGIRVWRAASAPGSSCSPPRPSTSRSRSGPPSPPSACRSSRGTASCPPPGTGSRTTSGSSAPPTWSMRSVTASSSSSSSRPSRSPRASSSPPC